jgi:hypothetical protein
MDHTCIRRSGALLIPVDAAPSSEPVQSGGAEGRRPLKPGERYARFGLIRRSPTTTVKWYEEHWLAIMLPTTLCLAAIFIYFAIRNGFIWSTIYFGVMAGLSLLTLLVRLVFPE